MFCCGVVQAAAMAEAKAAKAAEEAAAKAAEEAAARAAEEAAVAKAQVAREKVSCTCVGCVWLWPAQLLLLLLLFCHGMLILSCCDVPLSRCLCGVLLSLKMLTSVHVTCCFAHTAFVMVQWRILKMACFEYVSVVDTGTAAGAREGE